MDDESPDTKPTFSAYHVPTPEGRWRVVVCGGENGADYRTIFAVGNQQFTLAEGPSSDLDTLDFCVFIRDMFRKAMEKIGAPSEYIPYP